MRAGEARRMSREYFTQLGITQLALAAHIGVSVQRVDEFVRGNRGVKPETAQRSLAPSHVDSTAHVRPTTIDGQMTSTSSQKGLAALFASATLADLLRLLMMEPQRAFYQRELQRLTGAHLRQLQRDLERLQRAGLVVARQSGNRVYYAVESAHPAFADLRAVIVKTLGMGDTLRDALSGLDPPALLAFVYGSVARGDDIPGSDIDLLIVGSVSRREVASHLAPATAMLAREVNPVIIAPDEFSSRRRSGDHFVTSVLEGPLIWLVGDSDALAALA